MPAKIYIIRHGETHDNVKRIFQGHRDTDLTDNGHEQAKQLAARFKSKSISALYTSDLKRTCDTAKYLEKELGVTAHKTKALREHNLGMFEGWAFRKDKNKKLIDLWRQYEKAQKSGNLNWNEHKGESLQEFHDRVRKFFKKIRSKHKDENIILVTHGGTKNRILEVLGIKPYTSDYISFQNTSVTVLIRQGNNYSISKLNDSTHLK